MGNTTEESGGFATWLRDTLVGRNMRVMDLAKEIARREGIDERDKEDFRRRSKAIHGHISNIINHEKNIGADYVIKIADAMGMPHESVLRIAGFLPEEGDGVIVVSATSRGKIEALLASLSSEKQDEAIRFLEAFVISQMREQLAPKPAKKQKLKST